MGISRAGECHELRLLDPGACLGPPPGVLTWWDTEQAGFVAAAGAINSFGGRDSLSMTSEFGAIPNHNR